MPRGRSEGLNETEKVLLLTVLVSTVKSGGDETWGYELQRTFHDLMGRPISWGTLFPALRRLEARELVTSRWEQPERGPRRRMYSLTVEGQKVANAVRDEARRAAQATPQTKRAHA